MKRYRWLIIPLLLFFMLAFAACGSSETEHDHGEEGEHEQPEETELTRFLNPILIAISALDAQHVWVVEHSSVEGALYNAIWFYDGAAWEKQFECENLLSDICALDEEHVWATGAHAVFFYNGSEWSTQYDEHDDFVAVSAADENHVWAAGTEGGVYFYDGEEWGEEYKPEDVTFNVFAWDENNVWALSGPYTEREVEEGKIARQVESSSIYFYDGSSWKKQYEHEGLVSGDIWSSDAEHAWASGFLGAIFAYGGTGWGEQYRTEGILLQAGSAADADHAWAAGNLNADMTDIDLSSSEVPPLGRILYFDGSAWTPQAEMEKPVMDVCALAADDVWASGAGGRVFFYDGSSWIPIAFP